jgi:protein-S-isoprenylcysteine O-methyltransferase Ste14
MRINGIVSGFLRIAGYLVPLIQSLPPLGVWTGLMTLPFASYLIMIFTNISANLPRALSEFLSWFFGPLLIPEKVFVIIGLLILVYSMAYLRIEKKKGLITSGPYRLTRHPQYLGMILTTLGLTSWSVWILKNTYGIGFLSPSQTIAVWFIELFAYIFLAIIEEQYLSRNFKESFKDYKNKVSFFIPFVKTSRNELDILASVLILTILLFSLVGFQV